MLINLFRIGLVFVLFVFIAGLTGCSPSDYSVLDPQGSVAESQLSLIKISFYIMVFVLAVVIGIFIFVLIRFRQRPGEEDEIPRQQKGNRKLEVTWTVIPILLLAVLAVPTVSTSFALNEKTTPENALKVKVTAEQYQWTFHYPELGIKTTNNLHIPVGKKIYLELKSKDTIHSFWAPKLAGKKDVFPGRMTFLAFTASQPGTYDGKCAELCGIGHAKMRFKVIVHSKDDFQAWASDWKKYAPDS